MAITTEMLNTHDALKGLDPNIKAQIVAMSLNDENTVIAKKTREHWEAIDTDLSGVSGLAKPREMKSHEWMKSLFGDMKGKLEKATTELQTAKTSLAEMQEKVKTGGNDAALKGQVEKLTKDLADAQGRFTSLQEQMSGLEEKHKGELTSTKQQSDQLFAKMKFAQAAAGRTLREGMSPSDFALILDQKVSQFTSGYDMKVEEVNGRPELVFRDKSTGLMINNPKNLQQPLTAEDIVDTNFQSYFADKGRPSMGIGSGGGGGQKLVGGDALNGNGLDVSGVRSKIELDERIQTHLGNEGIKSSDRNYHSVFMTVREEAIKELPSDLPQNTPAS